MKKTAFLFSGQGSQYPGMGKELFENFAEVRHIYECASDILGFDVAELSFSGEEAQLAQTQTAQPLIYTLSLACLAALRQTAPAPCAVAGHSLGEYAALFCAGCFSLEDGFRIVGTRGKLMAEGALERKGAMFAIVGADAETVIGACKATGGEVFAVNFNMPTQTVISGEEEATVRAADKLAEAGFKTVRLAVAGAFHTPLMQNAANRFAESVADIAFQQPSIPFYSNRTGGQLEKVESFPAYFARHMVCPVEFVKEIDSMVQAGIEAFVELGPKKTATMFVKKICRGVEAFPVEDMKSLEKASAALV